MAAKKALSFWMNDNRPKILDCLRTILEDKEGLSPAEASRFNTVRYFRDKLSLTNDSGDETYHFTLTQNDFATLDALETELKNNAQMDAPRTIGHWMRRKEAEILDCLRIILKDKEGLSDAEVSKFNTVSSSGKKVLLTNDSGDATYRFILTQDEFADFDALKTELESADRKTPTRVVKPVRHWKQFVATALAAAALVTPLATAYAGNENPHAEDLGRSRVGLSGVSNYNELTGSLPSRETIKFTREDHENPNIGFGKRDEYTTSVVRGMGMTYGEKASQLPDVASELQTTQEDNASMSAGSYQMENGTYVLSQAQREVMEQRLADQGYTQNDQAAFWQGFDPAFDVAEHKEQEEKGNQTYKFAALEGAQEYVLNKVKNAYPDYDISGKTVEASGKYLLVKDNNGHSDFQVELEHDQWKNIEEFKQDVDDAFNVLGKVTDNRPPEEKQSFSFADVLSKNEEAVKTALIARIQDEIGSNKIADCKDEKAFVNFVKNADFKPEDITITKGRIVSGKAYFNVKVNVPNQGDTLAVTLKMEVDNNYTDTSEETATGTIYGARLENYGEKNTLDIATDSGLRAAALEKFNGVLKDGSKAYELADISVRKEKDETYTFVASKNGVAEQEIRNVGGAYYSVVEEQINGSKVVNLSAEAQAEALEERKGIIANSLGAGAMSYESGNDLYIITGNPQEKGKVYKIADGADNGVLAKALSNAVNNDDATNLITDNGAANAWGSWISQETLNKLKTAILTGIDKDTGERLSAGLTTDGDAELYMTFDMGSKKINGKTITYSPTLTVFAVKDKNVLNYKEYSGVSISIDTNELDAEKRETADAKAQAFMLYYCANFRADLNVKGVTVEENYDVTDENSFYTTSWKGGKLYDSEGRDGK